MLWTIDPSHSTIDFAVRHLGIATVRGRFKNFTAQAELGPQGRLQKVEATIDAKSIDTGVADRDNHLRSPDFFDVAKYPEIRFVSTAIKPLGPGRTEVTGDLTMHGVTKPVSFVLEFSEAIKDPWGNRRLAAEASGKLNRKDWGLTWNQVLEVGGVVVSDEVKFSFEVEAVSQAVAA
jgi:polyisoprenoid-binding protein YceI